MQTILIVAIGFIVGLVTVIEWVGDISLADLSPWLKGIGFCLIFLSVASWLRSNHKNIASDFRHRQLTRRVAMANAAQDQHDPQPDDPGPGETAFDRAVGRLEAGVRQARELETERQAGHISSEEYDEAYQIYRSEMAATQHVVDDTTAKADEELERRKELAISVSDVPLHSIGLNIPLKKTLPPWADLDPVTTPMVMFNNPVLSSVEIFIKNNTGPGWVPFLPQHLDEDTTITIAIPPLVDYLQSLIMAMQTGNTDLVRASTTDAINRLRDRVARIENVDRTIRM